jgi:predicted ATPase
MEGNHLIRSLRLQNLLSFGDEAQEIELHPLNVLIGPNASGKSNLIEAISLLRATPRDFTAPVRTGGGIAEWLWKGSHDTPVAQIEAIIGYPQGVMPLRYQLCFTAVGQRLELVDEAVENEQPLFNEEDVFFFYRYQHGNPVLSVRTTTEVPAGTSTNRHKRGLRREDLSPEQSVLSQRKDPDQYPEITYLGNQFDRIRLYREWNLGRNTPPRMPQPADAPGDFLEPDASNLGLVLNNLQYQPDTRRLIKEQLHKVYETADEVSTRIYGGTVQIFVHETGLNQPVPATRLSDGTIRYLCLLAILCHPTPPPLICIEEPELGMHPDIIPTIAELLVDASQRTQLIVTTHSDILVSALSSIPEAVIVCDRDATGSQLQRLDAEQLQEWLEKFALGDLWRMGEIRGTRW